MFKTVMLTCWNTRPTYTTSFAKNGALMVKCLWKKLPFNITLESAQNCFWKDYRSIT